MLSRSYSLGLVFIVLVALIWAASSVLVQYLYSDQSFHSPFLLTYVGTSLFTLWLPTRYITAWFSRRFFQRNSLELQAMTPYQNISGAQEVASEEQPFQSEDIDDQVIEHWTNEQHMRTAIYIAPVWFIANWTYNASLAYTSITSSTVLASTGSLFTFLFAVLLRDERFGWIKLAGVLLGVTGSVLTALHDAGSSDQACVNDCEHGLFGDFLGLVSAVGYGAYAVQTRVMCPHNEELYSMQLLLGYIGLFNMVVLSPFVIWQLLGGIELTLLVFGFLVVKGLFDNVLSDYLWLRSVILTNATVATVGLGLTIPLAFASDLLLGKSSVMSVGSVLGALAVLAGFILVNVGNNDEAKEDARIRPSDGGEEENIDDEEAPNLQLRPID